MRRIARTFADAARTSGRTIVAYQYSPLGGPLDAEIVATLHAAQVPLLLGIANAMGALRYLQLRRDYGAARRALPFAARDAYLPRRTTRRRDFLTARNALVASGVPVVDAALAHSEDEAVALLRQLRTARSPSRPKRRGCCTRATSVACGSNCSERAARLRRLMTRSSQTRASRGLRARSACWSSR